MTSGGMKRRWSHEEIWLATGEKRSCRAIVSVDSGARVISAGEFDATTFEVQTSDSCFSVILKNGIFKHSSFRYSKTSLYGFPNVLDMFFL